jgi:hypothetical protein
MNAELKTIKFRVAYFDSEVEPYTETVDNERQAQLAEADRRFLGWLTDWQEATVKD